MDKSEKSNLITDKCESVCKIKTLGRPHNYMPCINKDTDITHGKLIKGSKLRGFMQHKNINRIYYIARRSNKSITLL